MGLDEGDAIPDFTLPTDGGKKLSLYSIIKDKNAIIYFYPKDNTPGCTIEAKDFKGLNNELVKLDTVVIGVSKDPVKSHDSFKKKFSLPFVLISDESCEMIKGFGVWVKKNMYGRQSMGIERSTFLVDKDGKVLKVWRKVKVKGHAAEVLSEVKKL